MRKLGDDVGKVSQIRALPPIVQDIRDQKNQIKKEIQQNIQNLDFKTYIIRNKTTNDGLGGITMQNEDKNSFSRNLMSFSLQNSHHKQFKAQL